MVVPFRHLELSCQNRVVERRRCLTHSSSIRLYNFAVFIGVTRQESIFLCGRTDDLLRGKLFARIQYRSVDMLRSKPHIGIMVRIPGLITGRSASQKICNLRKLCGLVRIFGCAVLQCNAALTAVPVAGKIVHDFLNRCLIVQCYSGLPECERKGVVIV